MTGFALSLVLTAALGHAAWNFLAKKVCGGPAFIWLFATISALIYLPLALWILFVLKPFIGLYQAAFMLGSAALHSIYFILLDKGYKIGDLSIIYPLARGIGPLLSTLFAILCGTTIAGYTIWDKVAVSTLLIPPLLLDWSANLGRVLLLTPYALKNWDKVTEQWTKNKKEALGVAILCPLAYIMILTAMVFSPVSYIAPAREISILVGVILGAKLLSEGNIKVRLAGATAMMIGLIALST